MPDAVLTFAPSVDQSKVSAHSFLALTALLNAAECPGAHVSRVVATPAEQAKAMHDNCLLHGAQSQMDIYDPPGKAVIQVFIDDTHKNEADTLADMTAEIIRQGPTRVSHHCCNPAILQVFDLTDSSIKDYRPTIKTLALASHTVSKVLDENGVLHIEIPQPQSRVA